MSEEDGEGSSETTNIDFYVKQVFENENAAKAAIAQYNKKNFCDFIIRTNNKKSLLAVCKHGHERKSDSKGLRRNLHYNFVGCKAKINMYKSQVNGSTSLSITSLILDHNGHMVNEDIYNRENVHITDEEQELIKTLAGANTKPSQMKRILQEKFNKRVKIKKIQNLITKILPPENPEEAKKAFESFLCEVEKKGGNVEWEIDPDQTIKTMFITSSRMKSAFRNTNPPVVQLDTSFNFEKAQYKIAALVYLDPNTSKTEIAAFAVMAQETASSFEFVLSNFSKICVRQDLVFLVDKDFTEISTLKRIFPSSTVLLCIFHALKYIRSLVATALIKQEEKGDIFAEFKKVLYSKSTEEFNKENEVFHDMIKNVEVRVKDSYVKFEEYYSRNWESSKLMWVKCFRNKLPLLGDNTSNRVESSFALLKKTVRETFATVPQTFDAIKHMVTFADERLKERYEVTANRVLKIFHPDEKIRALTDEASIYLNDLGCKVFFKSLCRFDEKRKKMDYVEGGGVEETLDDDQKKIYTTSSTSCSCSFFANYQAPCSHMLFIRKLDNLFDPSIRVFDKEIFNKRYHRDENLVDVLANTSTNNPDEANDDLIAQDANEDVLDNGCDNNDTGPPAMSDRQKFKKVMPLLVNIANIASLFGTKQFWECYDDLAIVEKKMRRGTRIFSKTNKDLEDENLTDDTTVPVDDNNNTGLDQVVEVAISTENAGDNLEDTIPEEVFLSAQEDESRFKGLQFKEAVKTRGRPRKKSKQLASFNKTSLDKNKKQKNKVIRKRVTKSSVVKKRKVSKQDDFIDDDGNDEDLEMSESGEEEYRSSECVESDKSFEEGIDTASDSEVAFNFNT